MRQRSLQIQYYHTALLSVKRKKTKGLYNNAKPVLLLSLFDSIEKNIIVENKIYYQSDLMAIYEKNWRKYGQPEEITPYIYPFYYMKQEEFWHFVNEDKTISNWPKTPSKTFLHENIHYATLDDKLWNLLQEPEARKQLRNPMINFFFKPNNSR